MSEAQAVAIPSHLKVASPAGEPLHWAAPERQIPLVEEFAPYVDAGMLQTLYVKMREGWTPVQLVNMFKTPCSEGVLYNSLKVALWDLYKQRCENPPENTPPEKYLPSAHNLYLRQENRSSHGAGPDFGKIEFEGIDLEKGIQSDRIYLDRPDADALLKREAQVDQAQKRMQQFEREALQELQETEADVLDPIEADAQNYQERAEKAQAEATRKFHEESGEPMFDGPLPCPTPPEGYDPAMRATMPQVVESPPPLQVRSQYEFEIRECPTHLEVSCGEDRASLPLQYAPVVFTFVQALKQIGAVKLYREE